MPDRNHHPVDTLTMNRLLWKHKSDLAGVILRLAWRAGLKRDEIHNLLWSQVDFDGGLITLPDRCVPLDETTAATLESWREQISAKVEPLEYVVTSPRTKERLTPTMISTTAQRAMGKAGIEGIGLENLRLDFVCRTREALGDVRAIQLSGMSMKTYRRRVASSVNGTTSSADVEPRYQERLWDFLQQNREGALSVALWLSLQANLTNRQIIALTWDDIDLKKGTVRVGNEERYLLKEIINILEKEKASRNDDDDPHVILSPRKRVPMQEKKFSRSLRDVLLKNDLGGYYIDKARETSKREQELNQIRRFANDNGVISVNETAVKLGLTKRVVYDRIRFLVESGELVRAEKGYVPRDKYLPTALWVDTIIKYVEDIGYTTISQTADLLHIARSKAKTLLYDMEARGELDSGGKHRKFTRGSKSN